MNVEIGIVDGGIAVVDADVGRKRGWDSDTNSSATEATRA